MKLMRTIAVACATVGTFACSDSATDTSSEADGTMEAQVDAKPEWSSSKSVIAKLVGDELTITGTEGSGRMVKINVLGVVMNTANPDAAQTFILHGQSRFQSGFAQYSEGSQNVFITASTGGSGTIVIMHLEPNRAVGTFQFTGVRQNIVGVGPGQEDLFRRLTAGTFDVRLQ